MSKYLYPIKNLKTKSYIKWWLFKFLGSKTAKYILSEILEDTSFYLDDSVNKRFNLFQIIGRSLQDGTPTPENPIEIKNTGDSGSINVKVSNSDGTQEQVINFPLAQGQKFMEGDYLADDGVHHVTEEKVLTGEETIGILQKCYYINFPNKKSRTTLTRRKLLSNVFKEDLGAYGASDTGLYKMFEGYNPSGNKNIFFNYDNAEGGVNVFKAYLAEQYASGTPVKVQYELAQEVTDPYTSEQQTAWEQIKALRTYKGGTDISSENEIPPTLKIQYYKEATDEANN